MELGPSLLGHNPCGGAEDFTIGAADCDCRPEAYRSCDDCATLEHLGCTWVQRGEVTRTFSVPDLGLSLSHTSSVRNACRKLQRAAGTEAEYTVVDQHNRPLVQLSIRETATEWYEPSCKAAPGASRGTCHSLFCGCSSATVIGRGADLPWAEGG